MYLSINPSQKLSDMRDSGEVQIWLILGSTIKISSKIWRDLKLTLVQFLNQRFFLISKTEIPFRNYVCNDTESISFFGPKLLGVCAS